MPRSLPLPYPRMLDSILFCAHFGCPRDRKFSSKIWFYAGMNVYRNLREDTWTDLIPEIKIEPKNIPIIQYLIPNIR